MTLAETVGFVVTSVVTRPLFQVVLGAFTYEKRRGRESNPRIAVLQTATLPLGYPAICARADNIVVAALVSSADRRYIGVRRGERFYKFSRFNASTL
jgi:hypothetical protein